MCAGGGERQLGELAFTDGYLHQQHRAKPSLLKKFFFLFKDITVLRRCGRIETGTGLAGIEFAVPHDTSLGIDLMQQLQNLIQDDHLLGRAIVLVLVFGTARVTALIADPDTVRVVALDVAPSL